MLLGTALFRSIDKILRYKMSKQNLFENLTYDQANIVSESMTNEFGGKDLYLKGICIQGDIRNANQRIYPASEISRAVNSINNTLREASICGELSHPAGLEINLDRVTHMITEMRMEGANGIGKMKIIPTPMGNLVKTLIEAGVKIGVSSRGSGNVNESNGYVSDFEIVTVDIVANPSAPGAYPTPIYESLMNANGGSKIYSLFEVAKNDNAAQKYLGKAMINFINSLKFEKKSGY